MPAAARPPEIKNGLTDDQIWDLVNYCQAIGNPELRMEVDKIEVPKDGE